MAPGEPDHRIKLVHVAYRFDPKAVLLHTAAAHQPGIAFIPGLCVNLQRSDVTLSELKRQVNLSLLQQMIGSAVSGQQSRVRILGVPVDRLTMDQTIDIIEGFIASREPHEIITADSSGIVLAQKDSEFFDILQRADLVTADSVGVIWAAKRKGRPIPERVSGVDIFAKLCSVSAEKGYRLYFLGSAPGVAETAAERCRLQCPGCNIVGTRNGYFPEESDEVVAQEVAAAKPDVVFVAMGMPRQEKFIHRTREIIRAPVAIGVGGTLDVYSGRVKRAPRFVQALRLEWLWRRRFAKWKNLAGFVRLVLREK